MMSMMSFAQDETGDFKVIENQLGVANSVSQNGKYIAGSFGALAFLYDTETNEMTVRKWGDNETYKPYFYGVSNNGRIAGSLNDRPYYFYNNEWHALPMPSDRPMGDAFCISPDGSIIGGGISSYAKIGPGDPCIWTKQGDSYVQTLLPFPKLDEFSFTISYCSVMAISDDGNVLLGRISCNDPLLIVWTKVNGEWNYRLLGRELIFNLDKENPGKKPLYKEYVTAEKGTAEYDEQIKKYNDDYAKWVEKYLQYITGNFIDVSVSAQSMSGNGRYVIGNIQNGDTYEQSPFIIDFNNGDKATIKNTYENVSRGSAIANDGTWFGTTNSAPVFDAFVIKPGADKELTIAEYIKSRCGVDYSDTIATMNMGNSGFAITNGDINLVCAWTGCGIYVEKGKTAINYYVKFHKTADGIEDVTTSNILNGSSLCFGEKPVSYAIFNSVGSIVSKGYASNASVANYPKGIYIVKINNEGKNKSVKFIVK